MRILGPLSIESEVPRPVRQNKLERFPTGHGDERQAQESHALSRNLFGSCRIGRCRACIVQATDASIWKGGAHTPLSQRGPGTCCLPLSVWQLTRLAGLMRRFQVSLAPTALTIFSSILSSTMQCTGSLFAARPPLAEAINCLASKSRTSHVALSTARIQYRALWFVLSLCSLCCCAWHDEDSGGPLHEALALQWQLELSQTALLFWVGYTLDARRAAPCLPALDKVTG
jgi:hypothetical protein